MSWKHLKSAVKGRWTDTLPALVVPFLALAALSTMGCAASVGDCVQVYEFEGTVEKPNYTRAECEEECSIIGRTLQCFFAGHVAAPTGPSLRREH